MTTTSIDTKTINELESNWPPDPEYDSYVTATRHRLRSKQVGAFSVEDLRFMIGQRVGLKWLLPIALRHLEQDALAAGDLYPGDLLSAVLGIGDDYWLANREFRLSVGAVLDAMASIPEELSAAVSEFRRIV